MAFLTDEKLTIVGAAGMIGSNMAQTALMMKLSSNICLYDVFSPEGVAEEMRHCGFSEANIVATTDAKEAFTGAKYIVSSGGAPRKEGMTRPCRHHRLGYIALLGLETQPIEHTCRSRQHTSAKRTCKALRHQAV